MPHKVCYENLIGPTACELYIDFLVNSVGKRLYIEGLGSQHCCVYLFK